MATSPEKATANGAAGTAGHGPAAGVPIRQADFCPSDPNVVCVSGNGVLKLERGGDHIMFMGLSQPFVDGGAIFLTLIFEAAGSISYVTGLNSEEQELEMEVGMDPTPRKTNFNASVYVKVF